MSTSPEVLRIWALSTPPDNYYLLLNPAASVDPIAFGDVEPADQNMVTFGQYQANSFFVNFGDENTTPRTILLPRQIVLDPATNIALPSNAEVKRYHLLGFSKGDSKEWEINPEQVLLSLAFQIGAAAVSQSTELKTSVALVAPIPEFTSKELKQLLHQLDEGADIQNFPVELIPED